MPYEVHDDKIIMRAGKYNLPKPWVGLTDEEREDIATEYGLEWLAYRSAFKEVEAKLKEKNHA